MKLKIKKGATVQVITGSDKGKKGVVLAIDPVKMKIKVQGIKIMHHFDKKDGMKTSEGFFDYSNVKLVEASAGPAKKKEAKKKVSTKSA